jgi:hypothetical protein
MNADFPHVWAMGDKELSQEMGLGITFCSIPPAKYGCISSDDS